MLDDIHLPTRAGHRSRAFASRAECLRAATYGRGVFEFGVPQLVRRSAVNLEHGLDFGSRVRARADYLTLQVFNVGGADLVITSVQR